MQKAVSGYLRVLRNGGHVYGGRRHPSNVVLLTAHDGNIPASLPDLACLYLLHLLARPHDLRRRRAARQAAGTALTTASDRSSHLIIAQDVANVSGGRTSPIPIGDCTVPERSVIAHATWEQVPNQVPTTAVFTGPSATPLD